jgi:hypothetical protein
MNEGITGHDMLYNIFYWEALNYNGQTDGMASDHQRSEFL